MQATTTANDTTTPADLARTHYGCKGPTLMARLKADGFSGRTLAERAAAWHTNRNTTMATAPTEPAAPVSSSEPTTTTRQVPFYTCNGCGGDIGWDAPSGVCSARCLDRVQGFTTTTAEPMPPAAAVDSARAHLLATANPDVPPMPAADLERLALIDATMNAATDPVPVPPGLRVPTRADVNERPAGWFSRAVGAARSAAAVVVFCATVCGIGSAVQFLAGSVR